MHGARPGCLLVQQPVSCCHGEHDADCVFQHEEYALLALPLSGQDLLEWSVSQARMSHKLSIMWFRCRLTLCTCRRTCQRCLGPSSTRWTLHPSTAAGSMQPRHGRHGRMHSRTQNPMSLSASMQSRTHRLARMVSRTSCSALTCWQRSGGSNPSLFRSVRFHVHHLCLVSVSRFQSVLRTLDFAGRCRFENVCCGHMPVLHQTMCSIVHEQISIVPIPTLRHLAVSQAAYVRPMVGHVSCIRSTACDCAGVTATVSGRAVSAARLPPLPGLFAPDEALPWQLLGAHV